MMRPILIRPARMESIDTKTFSAMPPVFDDAVHRQYTHSIGINLTTHQKSRVSQLRELNLLLRGRFEQAEAQIPPINDQIARLSRVRLLHKTALLGPVIYQRNYSDVNGPHESGQILQVALLIPGGIGIVSWDSKEYAALREPGRPPEAEAFRYFLPFDECDPAIRGLLLPHMEPLLEQLVLRIQPPVTFAD